MHNKYNLKSLIFLFTISVFAILISILFSEHPSCVGLMIHTEYAFNYRYGLISRGFIGSLYALLDSITTHNLYNYKSLYNFVSIITIIYLFSLIIFIYYCYIHVSTELQHRYSLFAPFILIWAIPLYLGCDNWGRLDILLITISLIMLIIISSEIKGCYLLSIIASVLCCLIHEGYVFTYANILLVGLLYKSYKYMNYNIKKAKKFFLCLVTCFSIDSILFSYFQFFQKKLSDANFYSAIEHAKQLSPSKHAYHKPVVLQNLKRINVYYYEHSLIHDLHKYLICFEILAIPFLLCILGLLIHTVRTLKIANKLFYILIFCGSLTTIPEFILKIDYGRWVMAIIIYYFALFSYLLIEKDNAFCQAFLNIFCTLKTSFVRKLLYITIVLYSFLLQPLKIFWISDMVKQIVAFFDT